MANREDINVPFMLGEWMPDNKTISHASGVYPLNVARNTLYKDATYRSLGLLSMVSDIAYPEDTVPSPLRKMIKLRRSDDATELFGLTVNGSVLAFGGGGASYLINQESDGIKKQADITQFGDHLVLCQAGEKVRHWDRVDNSQADFAVLEHSPISARNPKAVGQFLMVSVGNTVYWSDANNLTRWPGSPGTDDGLSGSFPLEIGGDIVGITGRRNALIFSKKTLHLFSHTGGASVFSRTQLSKELGLIDNVESLVEVENRTFWLSPYGVFSALDSGQIESIGIGRIDKWIFNRLYSSQERIGGRIITGVFDENLKVITWHLGDRKDDNVLIYSLGDDRFTTATYNADKVFQFSSVAMITDPEAPRTFDGVELGEDTDTDSDAVKDIITDSDIFSGGEELNVWWDDSLGQYEIESDQALTGVFETKTGSVGQQVGLPVGEQMIATRSRIKWNQSMFIKFLTPVNTGGEVGASVLASDRAAGLDDREFDTPATRRGEKIPLSVRGVYAKIFLVISGGWKEIDGFALNMTPRGRGDTV